MVKSKRQTRQNIEKNSAPIRVYFRKETLGELSKACEQLGASISTMTNAAVNVALRDCRTEVFKDAKGAKKHG
jgi:hypothetical protein